MRVKLPSLTLDPEGAQRAEGVDKTLDFSVDLRFTFPFSSFSFPHMSFHGKLASFLVELGNFTKFVSRNGAAALFYLIEKVLLKLSSKIKFSQSLK